MSHPPHELAPSPPGVEVCSCDEALALRGELAAARALIARTDAALDARRRAIERAWNEGGAGGRD